MIVFFTKFKAWDIIVLRLCFFGKTGFLQEESEVKRNSKDLLKKILKIAGIAAGAVLILIILFFFFAAVTEYKPADREEVAFTSSLDVMEKESFDIMTLNIGYAGLGEEMDFFMDGGEGVNPESEERVRTNLEGIEKTLNLASPDFYFLQEIDKDSSRSYHIDETEYLKKEYASRAYAQNFVCKWVPYPVAHMIGSVDSGIMTLSKHKISSAERISLPVNISWPKRMFMLKRCMLVSRVPIKDSDKELVLVNFHLEAYDDKKTTQEQTEVVMNFIKSEYDKGNYVLAGGDFNMSFPGMANAFPYIEGDIWRAGKLSNDMLPEGFKFAYDTAVPTCRVLNAPFTSLTENQLYAIDGFILSPNLELDFIAAVNGNFRYTDHNPVYMRVKFVEE